MYGLKGSAGAYIYSVIITFNTVRIEVIENDLNAEWNRLSFQLGCSVPELYGNGENRSELELDTSDIEPFSVLVPKDPLDWTHSLTEISFENLPEEVREDLDIVIVTARKMLCHSVRFDR